MVTIASKMGEKTVVVPAAAKVYLQAEIVPLESLKTGQLVRIGLSDDRTRVVEVKTGKGVAPLAKLVKATGILIDVDRPSRSAQIFITAHFGDYANLRELAIAK